MVKTLRGFLKSPLRQPKGTKYAQRILDDTPRPRAALLMCLRKNSAVGNSAIGNYVVLYSKLILKTVLLEVSYGKND